MGKRINTNLCQTIDPRGNQHCDKHGPRTDGFADPFFESGRRLIIIIVIIRCLKILKGLVNFVIRLRPSKQSLVVCCQSGESDDQTTPWQAKSDGFMSVWWILWSDYALASRVWWFAASLVNLMTWLRPGKQSLMVSLPVWWIWWPDWDQTGTRLRPDWRSIMTRLWKNLSIYAVDMDLGTPPPPLVFGRSARE